MWINYIIFMQRGPLQCFSCILSCPWTCSTTTSALASMRTSPWSSTSPEVCESYFNIRLFLIFTLCQLYSCSIRSSSPQLIDHFLLLLKKKEETDEQNEKFTKDTESDSHIQACTNESVSPCYSAPLCVSFHICNPTVFVTSLMYSPSFSLSL